MQPRVVRSRVPALALATLATGVAVEVAPASALAQVTPPPGQAATQSTGTIQGTVTETGGRPVGNVQVFVAGTQLGAVTNAAGAFTIAAVPAGEQTVRTRRLGFSPATRAVTVVAGQAARLDVALTQAAAELDRVVVTGTAGAVSQRTVGNAVTRVNVAEVTEKTSISNVTEVLQSRTPGVTVLPGSGVPGTAGEIRIRGASSVSGYRPVIFVDGIRYNNENLGNFNPTGSGTAGLAQSSQVTSALDFLNPDEIESIEVIKGPAAATLYGADAANGVIQIITKKGTRGQQGVQWTARAERGQSELALRAPDNYTTCDALKISQRGTNGLPTFPGCQGVAVNSVLTENPLRDDPNALRSGALQRFNLALRGGGDRYSYYVSGDRDNEEGVFFNSYYDKNSARSNFSFNPSEKADFTINLNYQQSNLRLPIQDESPNGILLNAVRGRPGRDSTYPVQVGGRPISYSAVTPERANAYNNQTQAERITLGGTVNYNPFSWLRNRLTVGLDNTLSTADLLFLPGDEGEPGGASLERDTRNRNYTIDYVANVPVQVTRDVEATTSVGTQVIARRTEVLSASGIGLGAPDVTVIGAAQVTSGSNTFSENNSVGYYVQEQLGWKNRLFVTGAVRADDNSSFGENFDLIVYPKASLSYVASEEPALRGLFEAARTSSFKLRGAFGLAGRAPEPYSAIQTFGVANVTLPNGTTSSAIRTGSFGNPDLKPERGQEYEVGFESGHFGDRLGLDFTYYNKRTTDMLVSLPVAPSTGFPVSRLGNLGEVANSGVELAVTGTPVQLANFAWDTRLNVSSNRNRLVAFGIEGRTRETPGGQAYGVVQQHREGYPLGGYWAPSPRRNPDGSLLLTAAGAVQFDTANYIGPSTPTREIGFSNTFTLFRNVRLYALLDYKGGQYLYNFKERNRCQAANDNCARVNDPGARFPQTASDSLLNREFLVYRSGVASAMWIEPADFVKLREVSVTFSLPTRLAARARATGASLVLSGRNLALWSDYSGIDPEVNSYGGRLFVRTDSYATPMTRRVSAALNLTF